MNRPAVENSPVAVFAAVAVSCFGAVVLTAGIVSYLYDRFRRS